MEKKKFAPNTYRSVNTDKMDEALLSVAPAPSINWHFVQRKLRRNDSIPFGHSTYGKIKKNGIVTQKTLEAFVFYVNQRIKEERYTEGDFIDEVRDRENGRLL